MRRRRRRRKANLWVRRGLLAILAIPALYLIAALIGSLLPVNRQWVEPDRGTTIYLIDNGIHVDIVMPIAAQGLDWSKLIQRDHFAMVDPNAGFIAFGAGERRVYLNTPTWWDLTPRTAWAAMTGGDQVMHVAYVLAPATEMRAVRLRPEEYRRLWAAVRATFLLDGDGRPVHIDHPGYGPSDTFYRAAGRASVINTCNTWAAGRLRLAGVKTSLWPPFSKGLTWRYRQVNNLRTLETPAGS